MKVQPSLSSMMSGPSSVGIQGALAGLIAPGTITNLYNRPQTSGYAGPNGVQPRGQYQTRSTTYSKSFNAEDLGVGTKYGKDSEVLIPTVVGGKFLSDDEARDRFKKTGEHLGVFDSPESADAYSVSLHNSQAAVGSYYGAASSLPALSQMK